MILMQTRVRINYERGDLKTRKKIYINLPDKPDISALVLLDQPGITYVNTACNVKKGIVRIIAVETKEAGAISAKNQ
jgi:hypothetical protein